LIVYTTSEDENDAVNIWEAFQEIDFETKIITRNKSGRISPRLGILDENAYYKNSGLYIEVGRISQA
jgi:AAA+ ATPase superfamily predicted ATPase